MGLSTTDKADAQHIYLCVGCIDERAEALIKERGGMVHIASSVPSIVVVMLPIDAEAHVVAGLPIALIEVPIDQDNAVYLQWHHALSVPDARIEHGITMGRGNH